MNKAFFVFVSHIFVACIMALFLVSCTNNVPETRSMPKMTFAHLGTMALDVREINVDNSQLVTSDASLPTPPDVAIRRYMDKRYKAAGTNDTLNLVIDRAVVSKRHIVGQGGLNWFGQKNSTLYDVDISLKLFVSDDAGRAGEQSLIELGRSITIPDSYSLAQKEDEQFKFLELLMQDIDNIISRTIEEKMSLVKTY